MDPFKQTLTKLLFDRFEMESRSFKRTFLVLLAGSVLFFILIVLPTFLTSASLSETTLDIEIKERESKLIEAQLVPIVTIISSMGKLRIHIEEGPKELRRTMKNLVSYHIPNVEYGNQPLPQQSQPEPNVSEKVGLEENELDSLVRLEVRLQFQEYQLLLTNKVVEPLKRLGDSGKIVVDTNLGMVEDGLDSLRVQFEELYDANPRFWETYSGKSTFYFKIDRLVEEFWNNFGSGIEHQMQVLASRKDSLTSERNSLISKIELLKFNQKQISDRLSQMESPFGKIFVGLDESVAVFPLLILLGTGICVYRLSYMFRLRRLLVPGIENIRIEINGSDDSPSLALTPLFIDPLFSDRKLLVRLLLFSIPILVYIATCLMNCYSWYTMGSIHESIFEYRVLYLILYIAGAGGIIYKYFILIRRLRAVLTEKEQA